MQVQITPEMALMFGTPILFRTLANTAALNAGLERAILSRAETGIGSRISNVGGWQSLHDFLDWPEPEIAQLKIEMDRGIQNISAMPILVQGRAPTAADRVNYSAYGWANVNRHGDYNVPHVHTASDWSVVYYVSPGNPSPDPPTNGHFELRDPRPLAIFTRTPGFNSGQSVQIKPHGGLMLIFPAWIEHWVHPFYGEGNRISIAVNVSLERK